MYFNDSQLKCFLLLDFNIVQPLGKLLKRETLYYHRLSTNFVTTWRHGTAARTKWLTTS